MNASANNDEEAPSSSGATREDECVDDGAALIDEHAPQEDAAAAAAPALSVDDGDEDEDEDEDDMKLQSIVTSMCTDWNWLHVLYLSLFSTIGVSLRYYIGRFFGGDCEANSQGYFIDDWLWPLSHNICITANGETEQYGGALFIDLPANMFGSFVMGLMTGHSAQWPVVPCLSHDHPLQTNGGLHLGLRTALCGCLTTFSSWNSQMVLMMDGTANPYLGSQVLAALFGYIIGLQTAIVSFRTGRTLAAWIHRRKNPHVFDSELSKRDLRRRRYHDHLIWITPVAAFVLFGTLVGLYMAGDFYWGIQYYRQLWIACLAAPFGTILRWKLSTLNGRCSVRGFLWLPMGTYFANFIASILSAGMQAWGILETRDGNSGRWEIPIIEAISLGIAGSLSTVSTFVKECTEIGEKNRPYDKKAFLYSHGTMLSCCFVGLMVYSPIVRHL